MPCFNGEKEEKPFERNKNDEMKSSFMYAYATNN